MPDYFGALLDHTYALTYATENVKLQRSDTFVMATFK